MLFADADPAAGGLILGGAALLLVVLDRGAELVAKWRKGRSTARVDDAQAATAEAAAAVAEVEADEKVSAVLRRELVITRREVKRIGLVAEAATRAAAHATAAHSDCEGRVKVIQTELAGVKRQNAGQESRLGSVEGKVDKIKNTLGMPPGDGSDPQTPLHDTDEYPKLPPVG